MRASPSKTRSFRAAAGFALLALAAALIAQIYSANRLKHYRELVNLHTDEVHLTTRVFLDWLVVDAIDSKLEAMTLRRLSLLQVTRLEKVRSAASLTMIGAILLLILANTARIIDSGVRRLPDLQAPKNVYRENLLSNQGRARLKQTPPSSISRSARPIREQAS